MALTTILKEHTMFRSRIVKPVRFWGFPLTLIALFTVGVSAQAPVSPTLPNKELTLDAKALERIVSAKTVAVLVTTLPLFTQENRKTVGVTYRRGRTGPEKAQTDVEKVLSEWGVFSLIDDPGQADLVFVIEEQTLASSFASDGKVRLRDTLAVFPTGGPGAASPLWVGIDTESALAAGSGLSTPDAEGVVKKFRRDVENARQRFKK
jgi:hypothetical protein